MHLWYQFKSPTLLHSQVITFANFVSELPTCPAGWPQHPISLLQLRGKHCVYHLYSPSCISSLSSFDCIKYLLWCNIISWCPKETVLPLYVKAKSLQRYYYSWLFQSTLPVEQSTGKEPEAQPWWARTTLAARSGGCPHTAGNHSLHCQ